MGGGLLQGVQGHHQPHQPVPGDTLRRASRELQEGAHHTCKRYSYPSSLPLPLFWICMHGLAACQWLFWKSPSMQIQCTFLGADPGWIGCLVTPLYRFEMSTKAIFCNKQLVTKDRIFYIILLKNSENLVRKCP